MPLLQYFIPCFMYIKLCLFKKSAGCFFLGTHLMPVHFRSYKSWHEVPLWAPGGWSSRNKFTRAMRAVSLPLENCAAQWLSKSRSILDKNTFCISISNNINISWTTWLHSVFYLKKIILYKHFLAFRQSVKLVTNSKPFYAT